MTVLLLVGIVAAQLIQERSMQTVRPPAPPDELLVSVAVPVYEPDGSMSMETVTMPASGPAVVHMFTRRSICQPAMSVTEPAEAGVAWRVATQIVTRSAEQIVVSIDWRRVFDSGKKTSSGPAGAVQLTLQAGARIPVDFAPNIRPAADCRAVGAGLEIRAARGMTAGPVDPSLVPTGATAGGRGALNADLWLLHAAPRDRLGTSHQSMRLDSNGGAFTFPGLTVSTARGDVSVEIAGSIARYRTASGGEYLLVSLRRVISGAGAPPQGFSGSTSSLIALPPPEEVVSFEMPAVATRGRGGAGGGGRGGGGGAASGGGARIAAAAPTTAAQISALLDGHTFSLRMRVTPVPVS
jgi:hypothetical protein